MTGDGSTSCRARGVFPPRWAPGTLTLACGVWMHYPSSRPKGEAISHSLGVQSRCAAAASESSLERHTHDCRRHHFEITLSLLTLSFLFNSEEPYTLLFSLVPQNNRNLLVCVYKMFCKMFRNAHNITSLFCFCYKIAYCLNTVDPV